MIDFIQPGPDYRVTGRLTARQFRSHSGWFPVANVRLISADKESLVGVRLQRERASGPIELLLQTFAGGKERSTTVATVRRGEAVSFAIEAAAGEASVRIGGRAYPLDVGVGTGATVQITCSTGQFLFEELDWDSPASR